MIIGHLDTARGNGEQLSSPAFSSAADLESPVVSVPAEISLELTQTLLSLGVRLLLINLVQNARGFKSYQERVKQMDRQHDFMIFVALKVQAYTSPPQIKCISNFRKRATHRTWMQVISEYFGLTPEENQSRGWQIPFLR